MSPDELEGKLEEMERHLFDLRSQAVTEKLENSKAVINVRRDIARIKTIIPKFNQRITRSNTGRQSPELSAAEASVPNKTIPIITANIKQQIWANF